MTTVGLKNWKHGNGTQKNMETELGTGFIRGRIGCLMPRRAQHPLITNSPSTVGNCFGKARRRVRLGFKSTGLGFRGVQGVGSEPSKYPKEWPMYKLLWGLKTLPMDLLGGVGGGQGFRFFQIQTPL